MTINLMLNNGVEMPALGLGVFQTPPDETVAAVESALGTGYRHIDTAAAYGNEREVGEGIRRCGVDRSEVFIETKVWISDYGYDATLHAFDKSAGKLGIEQIDLLILHQALPGRFDLTHRRLPGAGVAARRRPGPGDRRQQLHARAPRPPAARRPRWSRRSTRSRCTPTSASPTCSRPTPSTGSSSQAWSPIGGITFYRDGKHTSALEDPTIAGSPRRTARPRPR